MGSLISKIGLPSNPTIYYPSPDDVFAVRYLLMLDLPRELADMILDAAHYWPKKTTRRDIYIEAEAKPSNANIAQWCYLVTPPVPDQLHCQYTTADAKIRMVRFRFQSCDQGWGGHPEHQGSYRHSSTWFEAAIMRPADSATSPSSFIELIADWPVDISPNNRVEYDHSKCDGFAEVEVDGKTRWLVQRNVHASSEVREHEVTWIDQDADTDGYGGNEEDYERGCGKGRGFLSSISIGDRIAIVARATYPGWINKVNSAEVDIFYSV